MPWGEISCGNLPGDGPAVIDKDPGVMSHDVVSTTRRLTGTEKIGYAGALDPMAMGILCIGLERATKLLHYVTRTAKEYKTTIRFGIETPIGDIRGESVRTRGVREMDATELARTMANLTGEVLQVSSSVSVLGIGGHRAYDPVREGREVVLGARSIRVDIFEAAGGPRLAGACGIPVSDLDVCVVRGAGTYVQALVHDLREAFRFDAHLTSLRHIRVDPWDVGEAVSVHEYAGAVETGGQMLIHALAGLCHVMFPALEVSEQAARNLHMGRFIDSSFDFLSAKAAASAALAPSAAGRDAPGSRPDGRGSGSAVATAWNDGVPITLVSHRGRRVKPDLLLALVSGE